MGDAEPALEPESSPPSGERRTAAPPLMVPTAVRPGFEVSVHDCPRIMMRELKHVFPAQFTHKTIKTASILAVVTCQHALMDLSQFGDAADKEKDRLLETFVAFAQFVTSRLIEQQYWADFIDPCSGLPMLTLPSNKVYSEVDGVELLLRYRCLSAGMCKILLHPVWGAAVYPASLFTDAPFEAGTSVEQDSRFFGQHKKLLAKLSFPPCFDQKVDLAKVKREVIDQWITERVTQLLGFEDDIVVSLVINLLQPKGAGADARLDPREMQLAVTGFLEKDAPAFMTELWELLLSAQAHPTGIPPQILEKKKAEMAQLAKQKQEVRAALDRTRRDAPNGQPTNARSPSSLSVSQALGVALAGSSAPATPLTVPVSASAPTLAQSKPLITSTPESTLALALQIPQCVSETEKAPAQTQPPKALGIRVLVLIGGVVAIPVEGPQQAPLPLQRPLSQPIALTLASSLRVILRKPRSLATAT
ncbi:hypothetical protein ATCC90586_001859 [Pythium insidiosum]|nr:hypothetical protein ATCC90586_001859 [Pythium insidiosum]